VAVVVASDPWTLTVPEVQVVVLMEAEVLRIVQNAREPAAEAAEPEVGCHHMVPAAPVLSSSGT